MTPLRAWLLASRPATLWAAVVPVVVGAGLAWGTSEDLPPQAELAADSGESAAVIHGVFRIDVFLVTLLAALAIQVAANLANDASDARRGADTPDRIGPPRVVAEGILNPRQVWIAVWVMFAIAATCGIYLAVVAGWVIIVIGVVSIAATLGYVGGPRPYGYMGLGELFVFVFFGVVATVGSRFVYDSSAPLSAWLLSVPVGFLVTAILVVNNIRDIDTDERVGKRTLAVILGRRRTAFLYDGLVYGAFLVIAIFATTGGTPPWTLLALAGLPIAFPLSRAVTSETEGPPLIAALKGTARLHLAVGVLLGLGSAVG